jgi:PKD repeat protein
MISAAAVIAAMAMILICSSAAAAEEPHYDQDLGQKYSYTLQFVFDGSDASSILWDFGDGNTSEEWNPQHTYAEMGIYYVTQTVYNTYDGGSESTEVYKVEIMGFPVISFDTAGGPAVDELQQAAYNVAAIQPEDPAWEGHTFLGWFKDSDLIEPYDWTQPVRASVTLYAGWEVIVAVDPEPEPEPLEEYGFGYWWILTAIGAVSMAAAAYFRDDEGYGVWAAAAGFSVATIILYLYTGGYV